MPDDAPALILAVPGAASEASEALVAEIAGFATAAGTSEMIHAGYLGGEVTPLDSVLSTFRANGEPGAPRAVIVPLMTCPNPAADAALAEAVHRSGAPVIVAGHLGPHPFIADALHARLAEAGLAQSGRTGPIGSASKTDGVLVAAVGGAEAAAAAGVVSVLLAGRLAAPVVPAAIDDAGSVSAAIQRLREAHAARLAISPCMIGPECDPAVLDAVAADADAQPAQPLGAHPAIGQLVTMRYGAALEDPRLTGPGG